MKIKAVIFDLDGTIIDTEKYFRIYWPMAMKLHGYDMSDAQALEIRSLGRPFAPQLFKSWFGENFDYQAVRETRIKLMNEVLEREGIQLKTGAVEVLSKLKETGITTAIATANNLEKTKNYVEKIGMSGYFDKLISACMVKEGKPSPDVYSYACEQLGLSPSECAAVEDSPNGVKSAYLAGCNVIMIPDQSEPDEELKKMLSGCYKDLYGVLEYLDIKQ